MTDNHIDNGEMLVASVSTDASTIAMKELLRQIEELERRFKEVATSFHEVYHDGQTWDDCNMAICLHAKVYLPNKESDTNAPRSIPAEA